MTQAQRVAQVLLDTSLPQLDHLFDYLVPAEFDSLIRPGQRVKVPLRSGSRNTLGYVVALVSETEFAGTLSSISEIVSPVPVLTPQVYRLARAAADRAAGSASDILRLAIPPRQVRVEKQFLASDDVTFSQPLSLTSLVAEDPRQPHESTEEDRQQQPTRIALTCTPHPVRLESGAWVPGWADDIARIVRPYLEQGQSVIVAVPDQYDLDVALTSLTSSLSEGVVTRLDSHQSNASRYRAFLNALSAKPQVLLGNRSALYAPAHNLGAIVMWDDDDWLFAEPLSPYVHARDVALLRSSLEFSDLIFASNFRSLPVERLSNLGFLTRTGASARKQALVSGLVIGSASSNRDRLPDAVRRMVRECLKLGPVLLQVGASGFGTAVICATCGRQRRCESCNGPLQKAPVGTVKRQPIRNSIDVNNTVNIEINETYSCRWCGAHATPGACDCGGLSMQGLGAGASATAEQYSLLFPDVPIRVSDAANRVTLIDSRPSIVIATRGAEPVAAGGYTGVVMMDVDHVLSIEALDADVVAYRGWVNAAALGSASCSIALVASAHPAVEAFAGGKDDLWLQRALSERQTLGYPPSVRTATITGPGQAVESALADVLKIQSTELLETASSGVGGLRALIRFSYASGALVAQELRRAILMTASRGRSKHSRGLKAVESRLRVHLDDTAAFDEPSLRKRRAVRR